LLELIEAEAKSGLFSVALIREILEDLLERCLADTILLNLHTLLQRFNEPEQVANSLVFARYTQLEEVAALLEKIHCLECLGEGTNKIETIGLHEAE